MEIVICENKNCGKEFTRTNKRQRYCSAKCRNAHNSWKTYHSRIKNDPNMHERKRIISKNWHEKNREYHLDFMNKRYHKKNENTN